MDVTVSDPMVGRLLDGRYLIGRRIARGGMASVYVAQDTRLDRTVAVKTMHPGYAEDPAFAKRFVREAQSAAGLSHPGVVAVFDQGEDDGTLYLAMEYVAGRTLRDELREHGALAPTRALELLTGLLDALAVAHEAGIVHLDIKPENVLLTSDGAIKVADFGLARAVSAASSTATQGLLIGTVSYLAPEQVTHGQADARSDLYSTGIVLYEMLTGVRPYDGDAPIHVAYRHVHENVPPPSTVIPETPPYVDGLVLRATARDPGERPSDTRLFLAQARRARASLARGLSDDPELTEDLTLSRRSLSSGTAASAQTQPDSGTTIPGSPNADPTGTSAGVQPTLVAPRPDVTDLGDPRYAAGSTQTSDEPDPPTEGGPRGTLGRLLGNRRRRLVALPLVLLLLAGAGFGAWYYTMGRYTDVPQLTGVTPAAAESELTTADLELEVAGEQHHEVIDEGEIVRTDPEGADRAVKGSSVQAWVSLGPERYPVPELDDVTEEQARELARGANLRIGTVEEEYHESVEEGKVIGYQPAAGTQRPPDSPINLVVSLGREPIDVPDVVGSAEADAEDTITDEDLTPERSQAFSDDVPEGEVISQEPSDGTLFRGDTVEYVVSQGPELIDVPGVLRESEADARETLENAGFDVEVTESDVYIGLDVVLSQSPNAGDTAPRGSTITISLV